MTYLIGGIQQVGVGVPDVDRAWAWYRRQFGMDVPIFQDAAEAPLMTPYTGGEVQRRTATLALNMQGGGGFEVWQYTSRTPEPSPAPMHIGDLGIAIVRIGCADVEAVHQRFLQAGLDVSVQVLRDPAGQPHFYIRDPLGLTFDVVPSTHQFTKGSHATNGPSGCMIGVSSITQARRLYSDILGYDTVIYDETDTFADFADLPGGDEVYRRVLLGRSKPFQGPFANLLGPSQLELVQALDRTPVRLFENRFWGDIGFIHLCFDIQGMDALKAACEDAGFLFTVDSANSFDMGEAAGRFSYIEDPDGTLIEFVETHRVPVLKKIGWYLNLRGKPMGQSLPNWMLRAMALNRVKG